MKIVGQILKEAREAQFYTLEDVERHTKIRKSMVDALERGDYDKLPPQTFILGFIKNYGKFLGLDSEKLLAVFRRDYESRKHPPVVLKSFSDPLKEVHFRLSAAHVVWGVVFLIVFGFFAYLWVEYRQFVGAPYLEVTSPVDQQTVDIPLVVVEGKTVPEVKVTVNDQEIEVDREGKFKEEIKLSSTTTRIVVKATSKFGRSAVVERVVFVKQ